MGEGNFAVGSVRRRAVALLPAVVHTDPCTTLAPAITLPKLFTSRGTPVACLMSSGTDG